VLGFILQNHGDLAEVNFAKIQTKIVNIVRFWERFNLSLPGKITIYKTLLIPQINFIASILTPTNRFFTDIELEMEKFVTKGYNISADRIYKNVANGGIGLFNLRNFVTALQVSWIKRASMNTNDNWKGTLTELSNGNVFELCFRNLEPRLGLALNNIVESFLKFKTRFRTYGNNYLGEVIFDSDLFGTGRGQINKFDDLFFGEELMNTHGDRIRNLKYSELMVNGALVGFDEFEFISGFRVNRQKYSALKNALERAKRKYGESDAEIQSVASFFGKIKKGSKNFRKVLDTEITSKENIDKLRSIKKFCEITESNFGGMPRIKSTVRQWNIYSFPNRFKVFIFKYYNNTLGTGNRTAHFVRDRDPSCNFCVQNKNLPAPLETFTHVFFDCPLVYGVIDRFFDKYVTVPPDRSNYFTGNFSDTERYNIGLSTVLDALRYSIWQLRLVKSRISFFTVELETFNVIKSLTDANKKLKYLIEQNPIFCIDGEARRERGRGPDGHRDPGPP